MEIIIKGETKEIADLILAVQSRQRGKQARTEVNQAMEEAMSDFQKSMQEYTTKRLNHPKV